MIVNEISLVIQNIIPAPTFERKDKDTKDRRDGKRSGLKRKEPYFDI